MPVLELVLLEYSCTVYLLIRSGEREIKQVRATLVSMGNAFRCLLRAVKKPSPDVNTVQCFL